MYNISIITPTKNSEKYILDNLESVHLNQNLYNINIEHIIIDGNSTDKTMDIIEQFKDKYNTNINLIESKDDQGMYDAINKGMQNISGDIWAILNSDDVYNENTLQLVINTFRNNQNDLEVVYGNVDMIDGNSKFIHTLYLPNFNIEYLVLKGYCLTILMPALFLRKSVIGKVGYCDINYKYASDYDYCIRLGLSCKLKRISQSLTKYRMHLGSITWGDGERRKIQTQETKDISNKYMSKLNIPQKGILFGDATMYLNQIHYNNLNYISVRIKEIMINKIFGANK